MELEAIIQELDYRKFKDATGPGKIDISGPLGSLIFEKGIQEGNSLETGIWELLHQKGIDTFGDLITEELIFKRRRNILSTKRDESP
ncbi:hypothetical protein ACFLV5_00415 [Chloroflexota bacterium]